MKPCPHIACQDKSKIGHYKRTDHSNTDRTFLKDRIDREHDHIVDRGNNNKFQEDRHLMAVGRHDAPGACHESILLFKESNSCHGIESRYQEKENERQIIHHQHHRNERYDSKKNYPPDS